MFVLYVFVVCICMVFEKCLLVDVQVLIGDVDGEVVEWVGCDVDIVGSEVIVLYFCKSLIVFDDVGDWIRY